MKLDKRDARASDYAIMLHNLIACLGSLFETILLDPNASERRVFSFAISDYPDDRVQNVLRLGLKYAYFSRSTIGRKEGFGRTELYILSRRLAPNWNLDPSGFSAYKFLRNDDLVQMMIAPNDYRMKLRREKSTQKAESSEQLELLLEDDFDE